MAIAPRTVIVTGASQGEVRGFNLLWFSPKNRLLISFRTDRCQKGYQTRVRTINRYHRSEVRRQPLRRGKEVNSG
jgi:hypothetical protein